MTNHLRASVATVEAFFSQDRIINLPWFQRAYAWRDENVLRLLSDVKAAMKAPQQRYSLGNIHLAGAADASRVALIDGHQRALTLAMMFAVLRDIAAHDPELSEVEKEAEALRMHALLSLGGDGESARWRLATKEQMSDFFEHYIQRPGGTLIAPEDLADLNPAERNLIDNRDRIRGELEHDAIRSADRLAFATFLLEHCRFVVIEVDDEDEAWSMLGIEQTTRLPHDASEQAKIAMIYTMPPAEQEEAAQIWESIQARLGNDRLTELLGHLRTMRLEKRSTKPLESELQQLYALNTQGLAFMRTALRPNAATLERIDRKEIGAGISATAIRRHIEVLSWLDHRQWVAPALAWLTSKGDLHRDTERFFARLERLAWLLRLAGTDPNDQENRFIKLTSAVARSTPVATWPELEIGQKTIEDALAILRSRTFYFKHMCKAVLRRLCFELGSDPGFIDGEQITIEHILPRRPPKEREWIGRFGSQNEVKDYADRLGNLCILPSRLNREADTNDWEVKRAILKRCSETGKGGFRLAADACEHAQWTPKVVRARTEKLIRLLFDHWELPITPP